MRERERDDSHTQCHIEMELLKVEKSDVDEKEMEQKRVPVTEAAPHVGARLAVANEICG